MIPRRAMMGLAVLVVAAAVVALRRPQAGPPVRTVALDAWPSAVAVDPHTGHAFIATSDVLRHTGYLSVLDIATGTVVHTVALSGYPVAVAAGAAPRGSDPAGRIFVGANGANGHGRVYVLDAQSGRVLHAVSIDRNPSGADAMAGQVGVDGRTGHAFVAGYLPNRGFSGIVSMLDASSGRLLRTVAVGRRPGALAIDSLTARVFVATADGVSVLDARDGAVLRTIALGAPASAMAVDERRGRVFVGTGAPSGDMGAAGGTPRVSVLDTRSGAVLATAALSSASGAMAVDEANGDALAASPAGIDSQGRQMGGSVSILDGRRGAVLRTVGVGQSAVLVAVDERDGRILVATRATTSDTPTATGHVLALDASSGALVRRLLDNVAPVAMAVDERAERAVVVSYGGTIGVPDAWAWLPPGLRRLPFLPPPRTRSVPGSVSVLALTR